AACSARDGRAAFCHWWPLASPPMPAARVVRGVAVSQANSGAANEIGFLQGALSRWRLATAIAASAALALLVVAVGDRMVPSVNPHMFMAVLSSANVPPAFVASVNLDSPTLVVRRLADPPPADRNYVLW